jgi:RNA polymerase sigma-70 factor, ECF subfamily
VTHSQAFDSSSETDAEDRRLILMSRAGNHDAFRQLVERHHRLVMNVGYRAFGNVSSAEDLTQEVFLKVYRNLQSYRFEKPFSHWLHRIAANAVTDAIRRRRPVLSLDTLDQVPGSGAADPPQVAARHEVQRAVRRAISDLRSPYRETIALELFHDLSYQEIADVLHVPLGTVMSRLHRARESLRVALARFVAESESPTGGQE